MDPLGSIAARSSCVGPAHQAVHQKSTAAQRLCLLPRGPRHYYGERLPQIILVIPNIEILHCTIKVLRTPLGGLVSRDPAF